MDRISPVDRIPDAELLARLEGCPRYGSTWQHAGGALVCIVGRAIDEATLEPLVLYRHIAGGADLPEDPTFARPLASFRERFTQEG